MSRLRRGGDDGDAATASTSNAATVTSGGGATAGGAVLSFGADAPGAAAGGDTPVRRRSIVERIGAAESFRVAGNAARAMVRFGGFGGRRANAFPGMDFLVDKMRSNEALGRVSGDAACGVACIVALLRGRAANTTLVAVAAMAVLASVVTGILLVVDHYDHAPTPIILALLAANALVGTRATLLAGLARTRVLPSVLNATLAVGDTVAGREREDDEVVGAAGAAAAVAALKRPAVWVPESKNAASAPRVASLLRRTLWTTPLTAMLTAALVIDIAYVAMRGVDVLDDAVFVVAAIAAVVQALCSQWGKSGISAVHGLLRLQADSVWELLRASDFAASKVSAEALREALELLRLSLRIVESAGYGGLAGEAAALGTTWLLLGVWATTDGAHLRSASSDVNVVVVMAAVGLWGAWEVAAVAMTNRRMQMIADTVQQRCDSALGASSVAVAVLPVPSSTGAGSRSASVATTVSPLPQPPATWYASEHAARIVVSGDATVQAVGLDELEEDSGAVGAPEARATVGHIAAISSPRFLSVRLFGLAPSIGTVMQIVAAILMAAVVLLRLNGSV